MYHCYCKQRHLNDNFFWKKKQKNRKPILEEFLGFLPKMRIFLKNSASLVFYFLKSLTLYEISEKNSFLRKSVKYWHSDILTYWQWQYHRTLSAYKWGYKIQEILFYQKCWMVTPQNRSRDLQTGNYFLVTVAEGYNLWDMIRAISTYSEIMIQNAGNLLFFRFD